MPSYELLVIFKTMKRPELVGAVKRAAEMLWTKGAVITKLENLGSKTLAYKMSSGGKAHTKGNYFLYHFQAAPSAIDHYLDFYKRDIDIVRTTVALRSEPGEPTLCTLEEELLPPAYRKDVAQLQQEGKRNKKQLYKPFVLEITSQPF